ncbi:MMPL family transporter [Actinomadura rugatobispora]|uniref:MMPL family transporter n=1 Tax=Actinomadura rugatobispora TaxID=1994 RepID=A0ABW1A2R1_9ACTN|nr:MMPL family transporter [Actinomadura rugatobispora]
MKGDERFRRARLVLWLAAAGFLAALVAGHDVHDRLTPGGTTAIGAESERSRELLESDFHAGDPDLVLVARSQVPVDDPRAAEAGRSLTARLARTPGVVHAISYWDARAPSLRGRDGRAALLLVRLQGDDMRRIAAARRVVPRVSGRTGPLTVTATGKAQVRAETQDRSERDLRRAELVVAPLTLAILLVVFGGLTAAVLPLLVGALAVTGTMAVLRLLSAFTEVSVFAMSIASALGFALALDFSLFIVTRFREELAAGFGTRAAITVTMRTTGRAMAYSAVTVSLSLAALLLFPFTILRSIAYGGIAVTVLAAVGSLVVLPAVLVLLGERVNGLAIPGPWRAGRPARPDAAPGPWFRIATAVMRRPLSVAIPTALLLLALGSPFLDVRFGTFDDRLLPPEAPAAQAANQLRRDFDARDSVAATTVVLPEERVAPDDPVAAARLDGYARRLSSVAGVVRVDAATGSYARGARAGDAPPGAAARFVRPGAPGTWLAVSTAHEPYSVENGELAERVRGLPAPGRALVGGPGAELADVRAGIAVTLPAVLGLIALTTFLLISALTGSMVLGAKALLMNALSLGATFGVLVHIFQEGHLRWLVGGFSVSGSTDALVPALLFCVAFGLSMDYEIFLLSRIVEEHRRTGDTRLAVATGLERTGRLFTSAAVIFAVVMAALATSGLALLKMIGVGLALAVLLDATLVRGLLVPAVMRLAGRANWWTPWPRGRAFRRYRVPPPRVPEPGATRERVPS